jgi:hypothetical protein
MFQHVKNEFAEKQYKPMLITHCCPSEEGIQLVKEDLLSYTEVIRN